MEQTLKKVTFTFIPSWEFSPNEDEQKQIDELSRKRDGIFHGITEVCENELKTLLFVIEDEETGKIYKVDPSLVKFKK